MTRLYLHKKIRIYLIFAGICLFLIGLSIDLIFIEKFPLFIIDIRVLFSAIITLAAISGTIITILIGALTHRVYGFTIKEVFQFESFKLSKLNMLVINLLIALFALISYVLNCVNILFFLLVYILFFVSFYSSALWKIVIDEELPILLINNEIASNIHGVKEEKCVDLLDRLLTDSVNKIREGKITEFKKSIDISKQILAKLSFLDKDSTILINKNMKYIFSALLEVYDYNDAINIINPVHESIEADFMPYDYLTIMIQPLKDLQFKNDENLSKSPILNFYRNYDRAQILDSAYKATILSVYFNAVINNQIASEAYKKRLLEIFLNEIVSFYRVEGDEYTKILRRVILDIVKNYVLDNSDIEQREFIFNIIVKNLFQQNHSKSEEYISTIAQIYRAIYFYGFKERESLSNSYREGIKKLVEEQSNEQENSMISFKKLANSLGREISAILLNYHFTENHAEVKYFEYFSSFRSFKSSVWTEWSTLEFAFVSYFALGKNYRKAPHELINKWDEIDFRKRQYFLKSLCNHFIIEEGFLVLSTGFKRKITEVTNWLDVKEVIFEEYVKYIVPIINAKYDEKNDNEILVNEETTSYISKSVNWDKKLVNYIKNKKKYTNFDNKISFDKALEFEASIIVNIDDVQNEENTIKKIYDYVKNAINMQVGEILTQEKISYDENGAQALESIIKEHHYTSRNYESINDMLPEKNVKVKLRKLHEDLNYIKDSILAFHMIYKASDFKFNVEISEYESLPLSESQINEYVERFRVADGWYKVDGVYINWSKAIKSVGEKYVEEHIKIRLSLNFDKNSGVILIPQ